MNYESYIKSLVLGKNVGLVNWPQGVDFKRMSLQSAIGPLRILYDSLKCGTTRWKVLSTAEKKQLMENHNAMVAAGDVREKKRNSRPKRTASKRGEHAEGSEGEEEEDEPRVQEKPRKKQVARARGSGSRPQGRMEAGGEGDSGEDEGDLEDEDAGPPKPIAQMSVAEKRARLLRLARSTEKRREAWDTEGGGRTTKAASSGKEAGEAQGGR
jgi:hypothetical protein